MHRKGQRCGILLLLAACGGMKDPGSVADQFVDRYFVESDQDSALRLTTGVASLQLRDELKLAAEGRHGDPGMQVRQVRVYYSRQSLTGEGDRREADYELDIRPQGGGELKRGAHLELQRQPDGTWRVARYLSRQE